MATVHAGEAKKFCAAEYVGGVSEGKNVFNHIFGRINSRCKSCDRAVENTGIGRYTVNQMLFRSSNYVENR